MVTNEGRAVMAMKGRHGSAVVVRVRLDQHPLYARVSQICHIILKIRVHAWA